MHIVLFTAGGSYIGQEFFERVKIFRDQCDICFRFLEKGDAMVFSHITVARGVCGQVFCEAGAARVTLGKAKVSSAPNSLQRV